MYWYVYTIYILFYKYKDIYETSQEWISLYRLVSKGIGVHHSGMIPILKEIVQYNSVPLYISILLFILKTLHYTFPILSSKTYAAYKRFIFNDIMLNKIDTVFFLLKQDNK